MGDGEGWVLTAKDAKGAEKKNGWPRINAKNANKKNAREVAADFRRKPQISPSNWQLAISNWQLATSN